MIIAPIPVNEQERLAALQSYFLLDSEPEAEFDGIVQLAGYICQTPISLVDKNRQWFKAVAGLDVRETSIDVAFCAHAILQDEALVVPDVVNDVRFCDNPLVCSAPSIQFYAGTSLISPEGYHLNPVCYRSCAQGAFIRQRYSFKNFPQRPHETRVKAEVQKL